MYSKNQTDVVSIPKPCLLSFHCLTLFPGIHGLPWLSLPVQTVASFNFHIKSQLFIESSFIHYFIL